MDQILLTSWPGSEHPSGRNSLSLGGFIIKLGELIPPHVAELNKTEARLVGDKTEAVGSQFADADSDSGEREALDCALDRLAQKIVALRLELPAVFFLEAHLPLLTIFHTAGLLLQPALTPFFGAERINTFQLLLADRRYVADLIRRIEARSVSAGRGRTVTIPAKEVFH